MKLIVFDEATIDVAEAAKWYNLEVEELGEKLVSEYEGILDFILKSPLTKQIRLSKRIRLAHLHTFPYSVFYEIKPNAIVVVAFLHQKRNAKRILKERRK